LQRSAIAKGCHSEEIQWGATENAGFNAKYNGILGMILSQNSINHCKNFNQFTAYCEMLIHANFPTFTMADPCYGGLM